MIFSPEIWQLIFQHLVGDYPTLLNISLVSHDWHEISRSVLLHTVDVSSHNIERRLTEYETSRIPIVHSFHHAKYRPRNLLPRQRKFLELITTHPDLAKHIKSFTWTLIWKDVWNDDDHQNVPLLDIDRETWNVFARLTNVMYLDLASIHDIWEEDIIRQNPPILFPKVTHLRLLGWMHRGLVKSIFNSINRSKLHSFSLDHLIDEGCLPNGHPMSTTIAEDYLKPTTWHELSRPPSEILSTDLVHRQETGQAAIFPGPMWYPFHLLSTGPSLNSLTNFHITVPTPNPAIDKRAFPTLFHFLANFLRLTSPTLQVLTIILGESPRHYRKEPALLAGTLNRNVFLSWSIQMAAMLLKLLLIAIEESLFPLLERMEFAGFHLLEHLSVRADRGGTAGYIRKCRFRENVDFTGKSFIDSRLPFLGFEIKGQEGEEEVLRNS